MSAPHEIISDEEIIRVHGHANFGTISPREVVNEGVRKYAVGFSGGHTELCILMEHGLITKPKPGKYSANLTQKGKRYARSIWNRRADLAPALPSADYVAGRDSYQSRVKPWLDACFGPEIAGDKTERNHRFLEESLELVQSGGCTASEAHQLVDYVYCRPVGEMGQEVGGVMNTLAALCLAYGRDMHQDGETELARVWTKVEKIRAKQAAKPKHSPLPEALAARPDQPAADTRVVPMKLLYRLEALAEVYGEVNEMLEIRAIIGDPGK